MSKYDEFYSILEILAKDPKVKDTAVLYPYDRTQVYNAVMERLAQPLPDGSPSPFKDQNPLSAEGHLMAQVVYLQELLANEINLIPDNIFYTFFRMLGLFNESASYPLITLELRRKDPLPIASFTVPIGTIFRSQIDTGYVAIRDSLLFKDTEGVLKTATARYSEIGALQRSLREREFSSIPPNLPYLEEVRVLSVSQQGKQSESLSELMYRARTYIRRPGDRVVTARDYIDKVIELGATKATILPRLRLNSDLSESYYDDVITVIVYPSTLVDAIQLELESLVPLGTRLDARSPKIYLMEGNITLSIASNSTQELAFNLAATAIQNEINPPNGEWGEQRLDTKIISAIRKNALNPTTRETVIFDVSEIVLTEVGTGIKYEDLSINPWCLFEIQSSITFQYRFV